jgi:hypothetical protein
VHAGEVTGLTHASGRTMSQKLGSSHIGSIVQPIGGGGFTYVRRALDTARAREKLLLQKTPRPATESCTRR